MKELKKGFYVVDKDNNVVVDGIHNMRGLANYITTKAFQGKKDYKYFFKI